MSLECAFNCHMIISYLKSNRIAIYECLNVSRFTIAKCWRQCYRTAEKWSTYQQITSKLQQICNRSYNMIVFLSWWHLQSFDYNSYADLIFPFLKEAVLSIWFIDINSFPLNDYEIYNVSRKKRHTFHIMLLCDCPCSMCMF